MQHTQLKADREIVLAAVTQHGGGGFVALACGTGSERYYCTMRHEFYTRRTHFTPSPVCDPPHRRLPADFLVETSLWPLAGSKLGVRLATSGVAADGDSEGAGSAGVSVFVGIDVDAQVLSVELWDPTSRC